MGGKYCVMMIEVQYRADFQEGILGLLIVTNTRVPLISISPPPRTSGECVSAGRSLALLREQTCWCWTRSLLFTSCHGQQEQMVWIMQKIDRNNRKK